MTRGALIALLLVAVSSGANSAEPLRLPPPTAVAPEAAEFDRQLRLIVGTRDIEALVAFADADVKLSFGGDAGRETLRDWAREDWFWEEWLRITRHPPALHGSGEGAFLSYPWLFADWPYEFDAFTHVLGREGATLIEAPDVAAKVVAEVGFAVLQDRQDQRQAPEGWRWLCVQSGPCGYAEEDDVASPIDWRAIFEKVDGGWRMRAFVAGD